MRKYSIALLPAVTLVTVSAALLPAPVDAAQVGARGTAVTCQSLVHGFNAAHQFVIRDVENDTIAQERTSAALPYDVTQLGLIAGKGRTEYFRAIADDGVPRTLAVTVPGNTSKPLTVDTSRFDQHSYLPRVFTASFGFQDYVVRGKKLQQVTTFSEQGHPNKLYFGRPILIAQRLHIKTLGYYTRAKVKKVSYDYLVATTTDGRLLSITVPVLKPTKTKVKVLKSSGFDTYTAISTGVCGKQAAFIGIDAKTGTGVAQWWSIGNLKHPTHSGVAMQMQVAPTADWRLVGTL